MLALTSKTESNEPGIRSFLN